MVRQVGPARQVRPGYVVTYPNRQLTSSRTTKAAVVAILLASVALMLAVTVGGWSQLQGLTAVNFAWCIAYLLIAAYVWRWARGLLPIAAGLAVLLLTISVIASTGFAGTSWFDRARPGYAAAHSLFGGVGLGANTLGILTLLIAPLQVLLVVFAMGGFAQRWNVEYEVPDERLLAGRGGGRERVPAV